MKLVRLIALVIACTSAFSPANAVANALVRSFAWPLDVQQLDPHTTSSDTRIALISHYLAPLVDISLEDNRVIPALAKKWQVSKDGKTVTLHLRKDAYWSDGTRLTAQQAKRSIERAYSPGMYSDAQPLLASIEGVQARLDGNMDAPLGVEAPNSETLVFRLIRSQPDFLRVLALPIASPVPTHQLNDKSDYPPVEKLSSSGPYRLIRTSKSTVEFAANEKYYGEQPHYTSVRFHFGEYKALIKQFLTDSVDTVEYIRLDQLGWLQNYMPDSVEVAQHNGAFYLMLKHEEKGVFDRELRKLLLASLDYHRMNRLMTHGAFSGISGLIPWGPPLETETQEALVLREKAANELRQLMDKRGYSQERPLKVCINHQKSESFKALFNFLQAHLQTMRIQLVQKIYNDSAEIKWRDIKDLCSLGAAGFASRTRSEEEVVKAFLPGGSAMSAFLVNQPELREKSLRISQLTDHSERKAAIDELRDDLLSQDYVRPIYKADMIALANKKLVNNYKYSKSIYFIPLSQHLKPPG